MEDSNKSLPLYIIESCCICDEEFTSDFELADHLINHSIPALENGLIESNARTSPRSSTPALEETPLSMRANVFDRPSQQEGLAKERSSLGETKAFISSSELPDHLVDHVPVLTDVLGERKAETLPRSSSPALEETPLSMRANVSDKSTQLEGLTKEKHEKSASTQLEDLTKEKNEKSALGLHCPRDCSLAIEMKINSIPGPSNLRVHPFITVANSRSFSGRSDERETSSTRGTYSKSLPRPPSLCKVPLTLRAGANAVFKQLNHLEQQRTLTPSLTQETKANLSPPLSRSPEILEILSDDSDQERSREAKLARHSYSSSSVIGTRILKKQTTQSGNPHRQIALKTFCKPQQTSKRQRHASTFKDDKSLQKDVPKPNNLRLFTCQICHKAFAYKTTLTEHHRQHIGVKVARKTFQKK